MERMETILKIKTNTSNPKFQKFYYKTLKIIQKARVNYSLYMLGYKTLN